MDNLKMSLEELLKQWGLDREVVERFSHDNIQINQLNKLTSKDIDKLIPKIGDRIKFQTAMENYPEYQCYETTNASSLSRTELLVESNKNRLQTKETGLRDMQCKRKQLVDQIVGKESEDDQLPLLKKAKVQSLPTDDELKKCIIGILEKVDHYATSMKSMFGLVYAEYPSIDLTFKKDFIRDTTKSIACSSHKNYKKGLCVKTSGKNDPKKKEFLRTILKANPVFYSKLLEEVKDAFNPYVSLLYAKSDQSMDTMKLNVKEGGFNCPLCLKFMTPQYKLNSNQDSIAWDVYNFRRHLSNFHEATTTHDDSTFDSSVEIVNAEVEAFILSDEDVKGHLIQSPLVESIKSIKTEQVLPTDKGHYPIISNNVEVNLSRTIDSVIMLSDDDEDVKDQLIELPQGGVESIQSIKTEPLSPIDKGLGHPTISNNVEQSVSHSIDSVIMLSDDDEDLNDQLIESPLGGVESIKTEDVHPTEFFGEGRDIPSDLASKSEKKFQSDFDLGRSQCMSECE